LDPAELQLLKALRLRRAELDERERLIGEREEVLAQIEEELMGRVQMTLAEIQRLERKVGLVPGSAPESAQRLQTLVTTLSSLSPRKAAPILARTSTRLAVVLLMRIGPERAGELLARMDPGQAGRLIEHLAGYAIRHPDSPLAGDVANDILRR
jgi:flagellar motility protein MotE (MotC chaperone)